MSVTEGATLALARAAGVALLACAAAYPLRALLETGRAAVRRVTWVALVVPFLTPPILVGYAYSNFALSLVHHPALNEALYVVLVALRLTPVAVLVLAMAPSPLSAEAVHCHKLLAAGPARPSLTARVRFALAGPARVTAAAGALVCLFAFAEFEMATLLGVHTWTVSIFDAQTGGTPLGESLRAAWLPALAEAIVLGLVLPLVFKATGRAQPPPRRAGRAMRWFAAGYLAAAIVLVTLVPAALVLRGTLEGVRLVLSRFAMGKSLLDAVVAAGFAAAGAYALSGWIVRRLSIGSGDRGARLGAVAWCVPGLFGSLLVSLAVLWAFQRVGWPMLTDSLLPRGVAEALAPLPLCVALALVLAPFAVVLRVAIDARRPAGAEHAAKLLEGSPATAVRRGGRDVLWHMRGRARFWIGAVLFLWAYFDLTAAAILAPTDMLPVTVMLYNFMHYGQTAGLSAMVCVAAAVPAFVLVLALVLRGLYGRWAPHV